MSGIEYTIKRVSDEALEEMLKGLGSSISTSNEVISRKSNEAIQEVQKIEEQQRRQADALKRQIIGNAEMTARNKSLEIVEENLNLAFSQAIEKLDSSTKGSEYEKTLKAMILEAIDQIGGDDYVVQGNAKDQRALKKVADSVAKERSVKVAIDQETNQKSIGGASVRSADGFVIFDNTYEARLERLKPALRKQLSQLFLEEK